MKQETILKGHALLRAIDQTQQVKESLIDTNEASVRETNRPTVGTIRFNGNVAKSYWETKSIPEGLMELFSEEFTRCLQRCKRHCNDFEFKLKQELEDLA
jgi:hypothetical protein